MRDLLCVFNETPPYLVGTANLSSAEGCTEAAPKQKYGGMLDHMGGQGGPGRRLGSERSWDWKRTQTKSEKLQPW